MKFRPMTLQQEAELAQPYAVENVHVVRLKRGHMGSYSGSSVKVVTSNRQLKVEAALKLFKVLESLVQ